MSQRTPLTIPHLQIDAENPFAGDRLGREALADRLSAYVDRLTHGGVIGIDAPWGEGKSWFGKRWAQKLGIDHRVAFIDAFESDYVDDPFILIAAELSALLDKGGKSTIRRHAGNVAKALVPLTTKAAINFAGRWLLGSSDLADDLSSTVKDGTEAAASGAEKWLEGRIEAVVSEKRSIEEFRLALARSAAAEHKPVVIFVDELDRCRPSFAVTLLERIKHLFEVQNIVFVLLQNRSQLACAIEGVYGKGVNGSAYLGKFINIWFDLPVLASADAAGATRVKDEYIAGVIARYDTSGQYKAAATSFASDLSLWVGVMRMSLRDIERSCALHVLAEGRSSGLLSYLIATKIMHPTRFAGLRRGDRAVHADTAKWLQTHLQGVAPDRMEMWPANLLRGLVELHLVSAEAMNLSSGTALQNWGREILAGVSLDRAFQVFSEMIDLPVGQ